MNKSFLLAQIFIYDNLWMNNITDIRMKVVVLNVFQKIYKQLIIQHNIFNI